MRTIRATRTLIRASALALVLAAMPAWAQEPDESGLGPEVAGRVRALLGRSLRDPDTARYGRLRPGRAGAVCGTVETRNRMGQPTGPRPFVTDLAGGTAGLLPDGPELRNPGTVEDFAAMQRILALYRANCAE